MADDLKTILKKFFFYYYELRETEYKWVKNNEKGKIDLEDLI